MALCLLAAYCAYFLPLGEMILQVALMIVLFLAISIRSPQLASPLYAAIVVVTLIALVWMVSHLAALLAAAAVRDPLTGVLNRRGLVEAAELVHAVVQRTERHMCIVAIDLNDFKGYNDSTATSLATAYYPTSPQVGKACCVRRHPRPHRWRRVHHRPCRYRRCFRAQHAGPPARSQPADGPQAWSNGRTANPSPTPSTMLTKPSTLPRHDPEISVRQGQAARDLQSSLTPGAFSGPWPLWPKGERGTIKCGGALAPSGAGRRPGHDFS